MTYDINNIRHLVKVLRNKKDTTLELVNKTLSKYYRNVNKPNVTEKELMDEKMFYYLSNKFLKNFD